MTQNEQRHGGLGRGLAALIPSGPAKPRLSDSAAEAIIGHSDAREAAARRRSGESSGRMGRTARGGVNDIIAQAGRRDPRPAERDPRDAAEPAGESAEQAEMGATYRDLPLGSITPNERQPRTVFDEDALQELVHSIKEFGLLQPIVVRPHGDDYELIMGERRWRAAAKAGLTHIPAIVRESDDPSMLRDALLENIHRVQLNPLEEGAAYQQLLEEFDVTQEELAQRIGRSRPTITNTIRLLSLPVNVQRRVAAGVLTAGHARALLGLKTSNASEEQERLADRIVAEGLSVRATEEAVTLLNKGRPVATPKKKEPRAQPPALTAAAERLGDAWDTRVTVTMGKRKGRMVIEFGDQEDFERILGLIEHRDT